MKPLLRFLVPLAAAAVFAACTQRNSADGEALETALAAKNVALGVDRLLLFPNPIGLDPLALNGGTFETNTSAYAIAYYAAIDPNNDKATLDGWRKANGFEGYVSPAQPGTERLVVFRDVKDLGYGRRMTARRNTSAADTKVDGSIAFYVENYNVAPGGSASYSSDLNVDAAIRRDTQWHVGTNAIEWSTATCIRKSNGFPDDVDPADCDPNVKFAKYYNFSSADGTRQLAVDLDGRGKKAMPGPCITCHGGRGDPLTPKDASGNQRFPLVENLPSRKRGDVGAHLHGQNVDSFSYSTTQPDFAKSQMLPFLQDFNQWILCTYPTTAITLDTVTGAWGTCTRPFAAANEWQGTAAELLQNWYGGPAMSGPFKDTYVPLGWQSTTTITGTNFAPVDLYQNVVAPYCRTCHILRGTKNQDDISFSTFGTPATGVNPATGFLSYADRIKVHVFDRGNMPLALIPHSDFWNSTAPQMLASFIDSQLGPGTATANGVPLMPGRPIPDPGPNRMVRTGANAILTGENSLFASSFVWSEPVVSGHVSIDNANNMVAIFNADTAGIYTVRLTVNNGPFKEVKIYVDDNFPDPLNIKFAHVKNLLQNVLHNGTTRCRDCHKDVATPAPTQTPPIWYTNFDRDGNGGLPDLTDDDWFLKAISGRVNLTEIVASPLLRKPTGNHHNGQKVIDIADISSSGGLSNYSILYNWILAGMQPGGVAANPLINTANTLTFSGSPLFSTGIALDGTTSIGATNFLWTVQPAAPGGPTGAIISNPTSSSAVLNVRNIGNYLVQLHVDDGISSDVASRTITVSETPVVADFTPGALGATSPQSVSFGGSNLRGDISLSSTSTGNPFTCHWQVTGPAVATLDGSAVLDVPKSCGTPALLNVASNNLDAVYAVTLTAISPLGVPSIPVTHNLQIKSAGSGVVANAGADSSNSLTFTNPVSSTPGGGTSAPDPSGIPVATVALSGAASTGPGTLTYTWSVFSQPAQPAGTVGNYVADISTPNSVSATLNVHRAGTYVVKLVVDNTLPQGPSNTAFRTITVSANASTFQTLRLNFGSGGTGCTGCHTSPGVSFRPSWENATLADGPTLYDRVSARIGSAGLANPAAARFLVCPSQGCAGGMPQQVGFGVTNTNIYTAWLNWIIAGAPNN